MNKIGKITKKAVEYHRDSAKKVRKAIEHGERGKMSESLQRELKEHFKGREEAFQFLLDNYSF